MTRVSAKLVVARFVRICELKGVRDVILSPGSRNAPLIISFAENPSFNCVNIPDERVAGFFALGLALQKQSPVILCCTSGSALLNYAPAVVEAYYQKIPLIIVSADRPMEWLDQKVGQTMRQKDVYSNYIKHSFELMKESKLSDQISYNDRICNEAIDSCHLIGDPGPVHINIPLEEPLYELADGLIAEPRIIETLEGRKIFDERIMDSLSSAWENFNSKLILVGQHRPSSELTSALIRLSEDPNTIILTETSSNQNVPDSIKCIDRVIDSIDDIEGFTPDLVLSIGGTMVSKKIRQLIRSLDIKNHWYLDENERFIDTYKALTKNILHEPIGFLNALPNSQTSKSGYKEKWMNKSKICKSIHDDYLSKIEWSDFKLFGLSIPKIPQGSVLHFANSTPIRYSQLFEEFQFFECNANRGVSGIDGCSSTAAGCAYADTNRIHTLITGDVAFFYDSNAFWHHHVCANLKIILINNQGGGIFRFIPGPSETNQLKEHFESYHETSAEGIAKAYGLNYKAANDMTSFKNSLDWLYKDHKVAAMVEVQTPREVNDEILRNYFIKLKAEQNNGN